MTSPPPTDDQLPVPLLPAWIRWIAVLMVVGVIYHFSIVVTYPEGVVRGTGMTMDFSFNLELSHWRHFLAYTTLGVALAYALADRSGLGRWRLLIVFLAVVGYGVLIEVLQSQSPDRSGSVLDIVVNGVGAAVSLTWYAFEPRMQLLPVTWNRLVRFGNEIGIGRTIISAGVGGIALGAFIQFTEHMDVILRLTSEGTMAGWIGVLSISIAGGFIFAAFVGRTLPWAGVSAPLLGAGLGTVFGIVLWFVFLTILLPIWFTVVGVDPSFPYLAWTSVLWFALYGLLLGGVYGVLCEDRKLAAEGDSIAERGEHKPRAESEGRERPPVPERNSSVGPANETDDEMSSSHTESQPLTWYTVPVERLIVTSRNEVHLLTSATSAGVLAGIVSIAILHGTGRMEAVTTLLDTNSATLGWVVLLSACVAAAIVFIALTARVVDDWVVSSLNTVIPTPAITGVMGVIYGGLLWALVVPFGLPLLLEASLGATRPMPYVHEVSLVVAVGYGLLLGVLYPYFVSVFDRRLTTDRSSVGTK